MVPMKPVGNPTITPRPSASHLAMQSRGLERVIHRTKSSPERPVVDDDRRQQTPSEVEEYPATTIGYGTLSFSDSPLIDLERKTTKSPSIYSTESAHSTDSTDSGLTTISRILDLYTNLVETCSVANRQTGEFTGPILEPKAYRDTIAPLLQKRYSFDISSCSSPSDAGLPVGSSNAPQYPSANKRPSIQSLADSRRAPSFVEFTRSLREKRHDAVSPISQTSRNYRSPADSDISPMVTPVIRTNSTRRPNSLLSPDTDLMQPASLDYRKPQPYQTIQIGEAQQRLQNNASERPTAIIRGIPSRAKSAAQRTLQASKRPDSRIIPHITDGRYYHDRPGSVGSDSTDSFVMYTGIADTVKGMLKKRSKQKKQTKEVKEIMITAGRKYPGMKLDQPERKLSWNDTKRASLHGMAEAVRRMSLTGSMKESTEPHKQYPEPHPAIPLTPYQKYGAQIWTAEAKKKRKEERRSKNKSHGLGQPQHSQDNPNEPSQRRKSSEHSAGMSEGTQGGHRGRVRGWRGSLGRSASEKRRAKLKASIVLVGPTETTTEKQTVLNSIDIEQAR